MIEVHRDVAPLPLIETHDAEHASRRVADQDCDPDVDRLQRPVSRITKQMPNGTRICETIEM